MPLSNPTTAGPTHQTNVTLQRALDTVYQNTTGRPLYVAISVNCATGNPMEKARVVLKSDASTPPTSELVRMGIFYSSNPTPQVTHSGFMVVLPGNYYRATSELNGGGAVVNLSSWTEWY